ncbi:MAG: Tellurite resistance protein-related protein [Parcubacteria group bacterium Gr01-1014_44]|nr:MAG: Tellurite resistance protein-related protein [Parcubacteria group bacterium Gr01-1014_44]
MIERTEEVKKTTIDFYDGFAEKYWLRHSNPPAQSIQKFIKLLPNLTGGLYPASDSRILDLGCGGGRDAIFFRSIYCKPICVDLSSVMCKKARKERLSSVQMDQEKLCFKPESFDGVWSRVSLLHSPPEVLPGILADLSLILKPKGGLFLAMKASSGQFVETEFKTTENGSTYYCYWPPYRLHGLLGTMGFAVEELSILGKDSFGERDYFEIFAIKE